MAEPNTPEDRVIYDQREIHLIKGANVWIEDGAELNIYGDLFHNGNPFVGASVENVISHGAVADFDVATDTMVTDSTNAFQEAIDDCPPGGAVYIPTTPNGKAFCHGKVTISKPISIYGNSLYGSRVTPKAGTVDALYDFVWTASLLDEQHKHNVQIADLWFDGRRRTVDCNAVRFDLTDRIFMQRCQIRNWLRSGISILRSCREGSFRDIYMRWNGGPSYAALDITDNYGGDGCNNLVFDRLFLNFNMGSAVHIEKIGGLAARTMFFNNCMIHGITPAIMEGQTVFVVDVDGNEFPVTNRELENPLIDLASVRDVYFNMCRIHSSGYGQPLIMLREAVGGPVTAKTVAANMCSFGDFSNRALANCVIAANVFTKADHHLGTGALVRVSGSALSDTLDLWVRRLSATTFQLHPTRADAVAGTNVTVVADDADCTVTVQHRVLELDVGVTGNGRAQVSNSQALSTNQRAVIINRTTDPDDAYTSGVFVTAGVQVETP